MSSKLNQKFRWKLLTYFIYWFIIDWFANCWALLKCWTGSGNCIINQTWMILAHKIKNKSIKILNKNFERLEAQNCTIHKKLSLRNQLCRQTDQKYQSHTVVVRTMRTFFTFCSKLFFIAILLKKKFLSQFHSASMIQLLNSGIT